MTPKCHNLEDEPAPTRETSTPPAPKTAKQLVAKRNQERVKSILLLAIPDEYLLTFHNVADAKSLWEAIKSRVYEDEMKRSSSSNSASQNLAFLSSENISSTNEVSTASGDFGIDEDDLEELDLRWQVAMLTVRCYNCPRKRHFARECRSGRNQRKRSYGDNGRNNAPINESSSQALVAQDGLGGYDWSNNFEIEPINYALMAISSLSSSSSSDNEVQKCSKQCLESFKTLQKNFDSEREKHSRARLEIQGYELALESLESRILGHEKNELAWGEKYEFQNYELKCREIKINNLNTELEKVVKERDELKLKIEKWEESSKNLDELLNSQMSARDKTGLGYGTQLNEMSNNSETDSEISLSVFDVRSSDEESTPANDRSSKADGYHVVPPPITGNFLTPRADISFAGLDEYAIRKKIIKSKTTDLNTKTSETVGKTNEANTQKPKTVYESVNRDKVIIEDWNSDDEDDVSEVQTVSPVKTNEGCLAVLIYRVDGVELRKLDLRWQVAMLTVRVKKFIQRTGRNLDFKEKRLVSLDQDKIELLQCYIEKGTLLDSIQIWKESRREDLIGAMTGQCFEVESSHTICFVDILFTSSSSSCHARDKTGLGYDTQLNELSSNHETDSENSLSIFDARSSDEENTPENDRFSKNRYKAVPPPITGNFLTPRADISFAGLDEYAIRNKIIESQTTELNTKTSETAGQTNDANTEKPKSASESVVSNPKIDKDRVIIEDWNSDDEEEVNEVQTVRPETQTVKTRDDKSGQNSQKQGISFRKVKACFVCKSIEHLIK
ncbi:putative ribonuclease H-like domain-containing protein [Tanacetum coccineum]